MKKIILLIFIVSIVNITGCTHFETLIRSCTPPTPESGNSTNTNLLYNKQSKLSLDVSVRHLLALKSREELEKYITVSDQNGNHVTHISVVNGQISVATQFMPQILDLKYTESEVPISTVIYQACSIIHHDLKYNAVKSKITDDNKLEDLVLKQITWDNKRNSLLFKFKKEM